MAMEPKIKERQKMDRQARRQGSIESSWEFIPEFGPWIPKVGYISRAIGVSRPSSRVSSRGEVKNWRKVKRWWRTWWNESLWTDKRYMFFHKWWVIINDISMLLTHRCLRHQIGICVTNFALTILTICLSIFKMAKLMKADGDRYWKK